MANIPERDVQRGTPDCMICQAPQPSSHCPVRIDGKVIGRICASHTMWEALRAQIYPNLEASDERWATY